MSLLQQIAAADDGGGGGGAGNSAEPQQHGTATGTDGSAIMPSFQSTHLPEIIEVGTPLIISDGLGAVRFHRGHGPSWLRDLPTYATPVLIAKLRKRRKRPGRFVGSKRPSRSRCCSPT
jgi:hypothetical protein